MASYQDIDIRLKVIEDQVKLIMNVVNVTVRVGSPLDPSSKDVTVPLIQLYAEMLRQGGMLVNANEGAAQTVVGSDDSGTSGEGVIDADFTVSPRESDALDEAFRDLVNATTDESNSSDKSELDSPSSSPTR